MRGKRQRVFRVAFVERDHRAEQPAVPRNAASGGDGPAGVEEPGGRAGCGVERKGHHRLAGRGKGREEEEPLPDRAEMQRRQRAAVPDGRSEVFRLPLPVERDAPEPGFGLLFCVELRAAPVAVSPMQRHIGAAAEFLLLRLPVEAVYGLSFGAVRGDPRQNAGDLSAVRFRRQRIQRAAVVKQAFRGLHGVETGVAERFSLLVGLRVVQAVRFCAEGARFHRVIGDVIDVPVLREEEAVFRRRDIAVQIRRHIERVVEFRIGCRGSGAGGKQKQQCGQNAEQFSHGTSSFLQQFGSNLLMMKRSIINISYKRRTINSKTLKFIKNNIFTINREKRLILRGSTCNLSRFVLHCIYRNNEGKEARL